MTHLHAHGGGGGDRPASPRVRLVLAALIVPFLLATVAGMVLLWPGDRDEDLAEELGTPDELVDARVTAVNRGACTGTEPGADITCTIPEVRLLEGPDEDQTIALQEQAQGGGAPSLEVGDTVVLGFFADAQPGFEYSFADRERRQPLYLLAGLFGLAVVALGRWQGLRALVGLPISLGVIAVFILPAVLEGASPLAVSLVGSSAVALAALYLAHGVSARTTTAVLGTLLSLALVGALGSIFVELAEFSGLADEEATFLQLSAAQVSLRGLLLGGIIIGALGVLDDVTVTQVSAVWELRRANPDYGRWDLYRSGLRIGRDHIASTVNTLVLAYAGASLPLLLLFTQARQGLADVLNGEAVAVEVVRTLVGSIGLVAAVPITTALAAFVAMDGPGGPTTPTTPAAPTAPTERSLSGPWSRIRRLPGSRAAASPPRRRRPGPPAG